MTARGLICLLLLGACAPEAAPAPRGGEADVPRAVITIGIHRVMAEVSGTPERQRIGLSGRAKLDAGRGMVFPYAVAHRPGFWMKDMLFDIDIVWIRGDEIVDISPRVPHEPPPGPLPVYRPRVPADLVLEVPSGTAERLGWQIGDPVSVDPPLRPR